MILKQEDKTYKEKFLCYEKVVASQEDETIQDYIKQARANMKGEPEETIIKISFNI